MFRVKSFIAFAALFAASAAIAQQYPTHPVRVIVGFSAGSGPDIQARTVSQQLAIAFGQSFYVENRLGANGNIATRAVTQSNPDGYTLLFASSSIAPSPYIYKNLGFDILTDLKPIASVGALDGLLLLVDGKSPIKSVPELIMYAKKQPMMYGSPGIGNGLHLATEVFCQKAGISLDHVPYKGASEVMGGLLNGSIQVMFVTPPSVMALIKDGRVRALASTGSKPFAALPDVPLMKDILPGYVPRGAWSMYFAPGKTPDAIVEKLNATIQEALKAPAVAGVMQRDGYFPDNRNARDTATFFRGEVERMKDEVKAARIEPL